MHPSLRRAFLSLVLLPLGFLTPVAVLAQDTAPQAPDCCAYVIVGTVFNDLNGDGVMNGLDYGLSGWTVEVYTMANTFVTSTVTAANGAYSFVNPVGCGIQMRLRQVLQAGWTRTFPVPNPGEHLASGTGCTFAQYGPYNFGNKQACPGFQKTYTNDPDFNLGTLLGVVTNSNQLELAPTGAAYPYAWIANAGEGTISKVSTVTGNEVARYYTGPADNFNNHVYLQPSRTVIDKDGNCWVANRNFNGQGSVTQILVTGGIDRNNNSISETSADLNNNGVIDPAELLPWGQDERVSRHYLVGAGGTDIIPRGLTIDKTGFLWVALYSGRRVLKVDPNLSTVTYSPTQIPSAPPELISISVAPYTPYGLALSPSGKMYASTANIYALEIDPGLASGGTGAGPAMTQYINHGGAGGSDAWNYGIAVDKDCIVWLAKLWDANYDYGCIRWDPSLTGGNPLLGWTNSTSGAAGQGRGITCDFNGDIWMAMNDANNSIAKFNSAGTWIYDVPNAVPYPIGVGIGSDGHVIAVGSTGNWRKRNAITGANMPLTGPELAGAGPYTYSDFTGSLQNLVNQQQGSWSVITDGGNPALSWTVVSWSPSTPPQTSVTVEARVAQNLITLAGLPWQTILTPGTLGTPIPGRYIETRVRLARQVSCGQPFVTPILYDLTVVAVCDTCHFTSCPNDTIVICDNGAGAVVNYTPPVLSSSCQGQWSVSCNPPPGFFPVGTTLVTCQAVSGQDDIVTCQFTITVSSDCIHVPQGACCIKNFCTQTTEAQCLTYGGIYYGDGTNCAGGCRYGCIKPPQGMVAWFPFDNSGGGVTPNLAGPGAGGTLIGSPTLVNGQQVGSCYDFNGTTAYITAPDVAALDIGFTSFTLDAWVQTTQTSLQTICDKRDASPLQGYAFFLDAGYPGVQLAVGGGFTNYILNAGNGGPPAFVADGIWHHVAVTVDRTNPAGVRFYVDGVGVGVPGNPAGRQGDLGSAALFRMARNYPIGISSFFFRGRIDELELFRRALPGAEVASIFNAGSAGKCREACYASTLLCCRNGAANSTITICNYSTSSHPYSWGLSPVSGVPGCSGQGANQFVPPSGMVTVPAGSCVTIPVSIPCPTGVAPGGVSCYQVSIFNHDSGRQFGCFGSVRSPAWWCLSWRNGTIEATGLTEIPTGVLRTLQLQAVHIGPAPVPTTFEFQIAALAGESDSASDIVQLNGLPPGTPVFLAAPVGPDGSVTVDVDVSYSGDQAFGFDRLVVYADDNMDGAFEPVSEAGIRAERPILLDAGPDVPETPGEKPRSFLALPNPFSPSSRIAFEIKGDRAVEVELNVYDLAGRLMKTIYPETMLLPGTYSMEWDGMDDRGQKLRDGMYFLKLETPDFTETAKFILLK